MAVYFVRGAAADKLGRIWRTRGATAEEISRIWRVTATGGVELVFQRSRLSEATQGDSVAFAHNLFELVALEGDRAEALAFGHSLFSLQRFGAGEADALLFAHSRFRVAPNEWTAPDVLVFGHRTFRAGPNEWTAPEALEFAHAPFRVAPLFHTGRDSVAFAHSGFDVVRLKTPTNFMAVAEQVGTLFGPPVLAVWTANQLPGATTLVLAFSVAGVTPGAGWLFEVQGRPDEGDAWTTSSDAQIEIRDGRWGIGFTHIPLGFVRIKITGAPTGVRFDTGWSNDIELGGIPPQ